MHLPDAPPPAAERARLRRLQGVGAMGGSEAANEPHPLHCSGDKAGGDRDDGSPRGECAADHTSVTQKQRNQIAWFAELTQVAAPSEAALRSMSKEQAGHWIHSRWTEWLEHR